MKGYTKIIDDEFASVVLTNQMDFNREGYRMKQFTFSDGENYPEETLITFTTNVHKYINKVARTRLEEYKRVMRCIKSFSAREDVVGTKYYGLMESACRIFNELGYSHEDLFVLCADICTYTRFAFMKGCRSTFWARYLMAEVLLILRQKGLFSDEMYNDLDKWLLEEIPKIEEHSGPIDLNPIELSLEWSNYNPSSGPTNSADSSSNAVGGSSSTDDTYDGDFPEIAYLCRNAPREPPTSEPQKSEDISGNTEMKNSECQETIKPLRI